jgi:hypothetical protein
MNHYLTVKAAGFVTYCDALIARATSNKFQACFFSFIGTASHIKATSAILFSGDTCRGFNHDEPAVELSFLGNVRTCRNRKIGDTINKVMVSADYFPENTSNSKDLINAAVIYGPNMHTVQERAFLRLDGASSIPLKPEWQVWLWDEIMQPEKLHSFGGEQLQEAYLISWPEDDLLQGKILEGITQQYLI